MAVRLQRKALLQIPPHLRQRQIVIVAIPSTSPSGMTSISVISCP
jgi:hypothetical protein